MVYLTFFLTVCALFSKTWIEVSGTSARDVAKQFRDQGVRLLRTAAARFCLSSEFFRWYSVASARAPLNTNSTATFPPPQRSAVCASALSPFSPISSVRPLCAQFVLEFGDPLTRCSGAIGSGTGILLAVTIIYQYYEAWKKEQQEYGSAF